MGSRCMGNIVQESHDYLNYWDGYENLLLYKVQFQFLFSPLLCIIFLLIKEIIFEQTISAICVFCRPYWRCYFPNTQAVIYVVDSSDTDRLVTAKDEFHAILEVCCTICVHLFLLYYVILRHICSLSESKIQKSAEMLSVTFFF